jgi:hypothetical protein
MRASPRPFRKRSGYGPVVTTFTVSFSVKGDDHRIRTATPNASVCCLQRVYALAALPGSGSQGKQAARRARYSCLLRHVRTGSKTTERTVVRSN